MIQKNKTPEQIVDEITQDVIEKLGKPRPISAIRNSQIVSAITGAAGLALFLVGIEKVFAALTGWASILAGILLMAISGVLLTKLR